MLRRKVSAFADFFLRTVEYKRKFDSLSQVVRILQKRVEELELALAGVKRRQDSPTAP